MSQNKACPQIPYGPRIYTHEYNTFQLLLTAPEYTWMQNAESVTVHFLLPEGTPKESIYITLQSDYIDVGFKNGNKLLSGQLDHLIDTQESTWTLNDNK